MNQTLEAVMEKPSGKKLLSPQERLELVLLGLARQQAVETLCDQAGVSRNLFYRWLHQARLALLQALEAKKPGRKPRAAQQSPQESLALEERLKRMEQETLSLRKERDRFKLMTEVAQRVIQRNGWNPEPKPRKRRVKKNSEPTVRRDNDTPENGQPSGSTAPLLPPSPASGGSAAAPIGGGSAAGSENGGRG